jgi:uncharacterized protein DUF4437
MNKLAIAAIAGVLAGTGGYVAGTMAAPKADAWVKPAKDLKWVPLDAKAGDKGPQVAVVFGDMTKKGPIGFILKAPPGFKPGPHTHSSDDYAVIISGSLHNFSGKDEGPGLNAAGTWFQPAKQVHDNKCDGPEPCMAFVYMPEGFDFVPAAADKKPEPKK